ncbi:hypothetical protein DYB28_003529 [Aphanomyces astaci]|uniref:C2 domain-containing protein n=1 Tax=Aphanomyces astaci TaxID=112090 RepID=A0A397F534_APHAT|nr:hypothetical protein DYB38_001751 [Aphanomyces astaci]RHZ15443.1 hypothetical protein DYB31_006271 [Aphanomyces astaci]RLO03420.1 hypothetical protein DYB28_003529 [Aphanomyces astaci]
MSSDQEPTWIVVVSNLRATDLPVADPSFLGGSSDPYLTFVCMEQVKATPCLPSTLNPVWHEEKFQFTLTGTSLNGSTSLFVKVWDSDVISKDDLIGTVEIPLGSFPRGRQPNTDVCTFPIVLDADFIKQRVSPQLHVKIEILSQAESLEEITHEVWENERASRGLTGVKWSYTNLQANERKHWSTDHGRLSSVKFDAITPSVPKGYTAGSWHYVKALGDDQGWVYASSFNGPWYKKQSLRTSVRRRRWLNSFVKEPTLDDNDFNGTAPYLNARVIRIVLEKATDLPASDLEALGGKSDPYVSFQFGKQRRRTDVIDNTLNPVWKHQEYEFVVSDIEVAQHKVLKIRVMDYDAASADDLLGDLEFDMTQWDGATRLADAKLQPYALRTPSSFDFQNVAPHVHMSICFLSPWEAAARLTEEIWENERWLTTTQSWSKNNLTYGDKHAWTSSNGKQAGAAFKDALPDIPDGYTQAGQWQFDISHGDSNGWVYATTFSGPWRKERGALHRVRRRLWVNHYNRNPETVAPAAF